MKIFAIISKCEDACYPDYQVMDDKVFSNRKDAENVLEVLKAVYVKRGIWVPEEWSIISFELVENKEATTDTAKITVEAKE